MKRVMNPLFLALAAGCMCSQWASAASLIEFQAGAVVKAGATIGNPALLIERPVVLDLAGVNADTLQLSVPIDGGRRLILERTKIERDLSDGSWYWTGRGAKGMEAYQGRFLFTAQSASGIVHGPQRQWRLNPNGNGSFSWEELDATKLALAHGADVVHRGAPAAGAQSVTPPPSAGLKAGEASVVVDVLVAVDTRLHANYADAYARAKREITTANEMFLDSQTNVRLRLAGVQQLSDVPLTGAEYQLSPLVNTADGVMDAVHAKRNDVNADIVVLLSKTSGAVCGIAEALLPTAAQAFAVVNGQSGCDDRLFAHEVGHLFSADHDDVTYNPTNTKPYARGYFVNLPGEAAALSYATIMTYNTSDRCIVGYNLRNPIYGYCQPARVFSNPDITNESVPAGDALHNNARAIREEAARVAAFRSYTGTLIRTGTWTNANRPGPGLQFSRSGTGVIATWYTYRTNGTPIWYHTDLAPVVNGVWTSNLKIARRNTSTGAVTVSTIGKIRLSLYNRQEGELQWDFYDNGTGWDGYENQQYLFGGSSYEGVWHEPALPGWGITMSEGGSQSGGVVYYFLGTEPAWVSSEAIPGQPIGNRSYSLRRYTGTGLCPQPICSFQPYSISAVPAGSMQLNLTSTGGTALVRISTPEGSWTRLNSTTPATMERLTSQ